jgi:hypothetical protein
MKAIVVTIPVDRKTYRHYKDPNGEYESSFCLVKVKDLPKDLPLDVNPRNQNMQSRVSRNIAATLEDEPEKFSLFNRGITIICAEARHDNKEDSLKLEFSSDRHGIVDGGHTYSVSIASQDENADSDAYVRLEVLTGIKSANLIADLARARNTSAQVKDESLANLQGKFEWIKDALKDEKFASKIAWRENEDSDEMPIGVREIIGFMTMFHPNYQESDTPPLIAYSSKGRCMELFTSNDKEVATGYKRLEKILPQILKLYDWVHVEFERHYRAIGGFGGLAGKQGEVKLGKVVEVKHYKEAGYPLYFLEPQKDKEYSPEGMPLQRTVEFKFPDGWLFPVVAALRGCAKYGGEVRPIGWAFDPFEYFQEYGKPLVEAVLKTSKELGRNPNAIGKNQSLWTHLHDKVLMKRYRLLGVDLEKEKE